MSESGPKPTCNSCRQMSAYRGIVLQNSKMRWRQNFAAHPSERIFGDPMPPKELTKATG